MVNILLRVKSYVALLYLSSLRHLEATTMLSDAVQETKVKDCLTLCKLTANLASDNQ